MDGVAALLRSLSWMLLAIAIGLGPRQALLAAGKTRLPTVATVIRSLVAAGSGAVFILWWDLGGPGLFYALLAGSVVESAMCWVGFERARLPPGRVTAAQVRETIRLGLPCGAQATLAVGALLLVSVILAWRSDTSVALHQLVIQFTGPALGLNLALTDATTVMVSWADGARQYLRQRLVVRTAVVWTMVLGVATGLGFGAALRNPGAPADR